VLVNVDFETNVLLLYVNPKWRVATKALA